MSRQEAIKNGYIVDRRYGVYCAEYHNMVATINTSNSVPLVQSGQQLEIQSLIDKPYAIQEATPGDYSKLLVTQDGKTVLILREFKR